MNGVELAPGVLFAATGLALSYAAHWRLLVLGLAVLLGAMFGAASLALGPAPIGAVLTACWIGVVGAALCVHLPARLGLAAVLALGLNAGVWGGLAVAAEGRPAVLVMTLPWTLLCLPGAVLVSRGRGVAVKVVLSWLAAAAVLSLGLNMTPTLGYEPDHMG